MAEDGQPAAGAGPRPVEGVASVVPSESIVVPATPVRRVEKPWGHELWWALTDRYAAKILVVEAGERLSVQLHREKDESSYLLEGRLWLWQGPTAEHLERTLLTPGMAWRNLPGTVHAIEAIERATVLEASTPQLDDIVRIEDRYGRAAALPGSHGDPAGGSVQPADPEGAP